MSRPVKKWGGAGLSKRAFTLIEVLVATVLVAVALVGVMGGIRALGRADVKARSADLLQRLAARKLNGIGVVEDPQSMDEKGDFSDQGYADVTWTADIQPSGVENMDQITITTTRGEATQSLTGLVFVRPATTEAGATP